MKTHKTSGILALLIILSATGCDESVTPPRGGTLAFDGPATINFAIGSSQSVEYIAENSAGEAIDVEVLELPDGATYSISNVAGDYRKKVTVTWAPGDDDEGAAHHVQLLVKDRTGGEELEGSFMIYAHRAGRLLLIGPESVVVSCGTTHTISYLATHTGEKAIDVRVVGLPPGATYETSNDGADYKKRVSVNWSPGADAEGAHYNVTLLATEIQGVQRTARSFGVQCKSTDPFEP